MNKNKKVVHMYNVHSPFPGLYSLILNEKNNLKKNIFSFFLKRKLEKKKFIKNIIDNNFYNFNKLNKKKLKILDLGCGTGENTVAFSQYFFKSKIIGVDASKASIKLANKLKNFLNLKNLDFKIKNIQNENLNKLGKFNFIICAGVLHHLSNPKKELIKITKILDKKGILILKIYNKNGLFLEMQTRSAIKKLFPDEKNFANSLNFVKRSKLKRGLQKHGYPSGKNIGKIFFKLRGIWEFVKSFGTSPYFSLKKFSTEEYDAFINPIVHYYDSKKIKELIANTNLKLINFYFDTSYSINFNELINEKLKTKDIYKILDIKEKLLGPAITKLILKKKTK